MLGEIAFYAVNSLTKYENASAILNDTIFGDGNQGQIVATTFDNEIWLRNDILY